MPVFHTKTIESILEPVAQQVSKLVILHEEAEDGNAMPDLARPVQAVKLAVDNLIKVGYETINNSEDQILKQEMPPALNRVEEASVLLIQASDMLRVDPYSAAARKKLIEGSRGILQGTSALLLAFDESEVRKIIRICKNVLEYLAITEVVESLEDLVTFVKNLSPVLTKMAKEVDTRERELTHQVHREWLQRAIEQVKQLTPALISGIKIFVTTKTQGGPGLEEAQSNRDYVTQKMSNEIHEIIRVLQLTTYDEEEWDADDITVMKKAQNVIDGKMKQAQDWLVDTQAVVGGAGENALRQILEDSLCIANRCVNPEDGENITKTVSNIESMINALCELRQQGKGNTPQALSLSRGIVQMLRELHDKCQKAVTASERSGLKKPAHTVVGKLEQAQRWLANSAMDDKGLGQQAARMMISDGRKVAESLQGPRRADILQLCNEVENLTDQLTDLSHKGMANSPQARAVAAALTQKLHQLKSKVQDALVTQVADDFMDISTPLKMMSDAAMAPYGTPKREETFEERARNFANHASKLAATGRSLAKSGGCNDRRTVEGIQTCAQQVDDLIPHMVKAARIVLMNPANQASVEHYDLLKSQWTDNMEKLRGLVDEAIDTAAFIRANEEGILQDTDRTEQAVRNLDAPGIVNNTSSIARRAHRILQVAKSEADNSEDPLFVERVNDAINDLRNTIAPMVQNAKVLAQNPRDPQAVGGWRAANQQLINAVGCVRQAVGDRTSNQYPHGPDFPAPPDFGQLNISEPSSRSSRSLTSPKPSLSSPKPVDDFQKLVDEAEGAVRSAMSGLWSAPHRSNLRAEQMPHHQQLGSVPPPIPPPPAPESYSPGSYRDHGEHAPPRPPLPRDTAPPRPPPPETDDEFEMTFPAPQANQPIMMAAHALHMDVKQWSSRDNEIISAAKKMALLMARLSQLVRGEGGTKKDLIDCAKAIAEQSEEVTRIAKGLAMDCTDKRMRTNLLQVCERIPTIGTQLKILSTVKATMLGAQEPIACPDGSEIVCGSDEDMEATEMLVGNAQNLMQSVRETVQCAEAASIKIRVDSGYTIRWNRKRPWYT